MAVALKHQFQSTEPDGSDPDLVQPSNWNDNHVLTGAANKLLGFNSSGTGTEVLLGGGLTYDGTTVDVSSSVTATSIALAIALG